MKSSEDPRPGGTLASKLTKYTFATAGGVAGMTAGFESSEAALCVTQTSICLEDKSTTLPQVSIDLDGDASDDIQITITSADMAVARGLNGGSIAGAMGVNNFWYPSAMAVGQSVSAGQSFSAQATPTPTSPNSFGTLAFEAPVSVGNWLGGNDAYIGVQFTIGTDIHYGWVHVVWDPNPAPPATGILNSTLKIDSYAFEKIAGQAALIPEPSSLVLLALGTLGLARRRRGSI